MNVKKNLTFYFFFNFFFYILYSTYLHSLVPAVNQIDVNIKCGPGVRVSALVTMILIFLRLYGSLPIRQCFVRQGDEGASHFNELIAVLSRSR